MPIRHLETLFLDPESNFPLHTSASPKYCKKNNHLRKNGPKKAKKGVKRAKISKKKLSRYMGPMGEATPKL